jgi:hypothetical protein
MEAIRDQPMGCASRATQTPACLVTAKQIMTIKELQIPVSLKADMNKPDPQNLPDEEKLIRLPLQGSKNSKRNHKSHELLS